MIKYISIIFLSLLKIAISLRYNGGPVGYGVSQIPIPPQQNLYSYQQLLPYQYQGNLNYGVPMNYNSFQYLSPYINSNGILGGYSSYTPYSNSYQSLFNSYNPSSSYNLMVPSISSLPYTSTYGSSNIFGYTNSGMSITGGLAPSSIAGYPSYMGSYPFVKKA
uniref:Uncharacterized protein n=1 Tax=Strongyloides venezuelensis TaxID=75913 RepID=A0A0K0FJY9_STRVS